MKKGIKRIPAVTATLMALKAAVDKRLLQFDREVEEAEEEVSLQSWREFNERPRNVWDWRPLVGDGPAARRAHEEALVAHFNKWEPLFERAEARLASAIASRSSEERYLQLL